MQEPLSGPGRFFRGNLHTHSTLSDAIRSPEDVCALYRDGGYDFISLTDHFLPKYGFPIADTRDFRTNRFTTILGAEVHAPSTELGEMWHILSVGLPLDFEPTTAAETGPELAARCVAAGAFVALPHPAWNGMTVGDADAIPCAHAVELYNHTSHVEEDRGDGTVMLDSLLSKGRRIWGCATDDAHFKRNDWFGGWVMVKSETLEPEALVDALKAGRFYSSQGPEIHALQVSSTEVIVECSPASSIIALGRGSAGAFSTAPGQRSARLPLDKFRKGGWLRVVVVDEAGRRAWSNPVWLDD
jgi:hypothetical protein